jgi:orotate phosphoribosyltransferase
MFVSRIAIVRDGYSGYGYNKPDPSKPFRATIEVHGNHGKVELNLSPELSERVVALIAEDVAAAGRATAEAMTAAVLNVAALAAPEAA